MAEETTGRTGAKTGFVPPIARTPEEIAARKGKIARSAMVPLAVAGTAGYLLLSKKTPPIIKIGLVGGAVGFGFWFANAWK